MFPDIDRTQPRRSPLINEELGHLYDLTDWRVVLLDERIPGKYNEISTLKMLKAFALPFLIEVPSERAIFRVLREREPLRILCGFLPGQKIPEERSFWHFRRSLVKVNVFQEIMLKVLISMVLSGKRPNFNLPFVVPVSETERIPEGEQSEIQLDVYRSPVELWTAPNGVDEETLSLDTLKAKLRAANDLEQWRHLLEEFDKAKRGRKKGLSGDLGLPVEIRTNLHGGEVVRFAIDRPRWLEVPTQQVDTLTTLGPSSLRPYSACNVLVIKKEENGKRKILLSRRNSGVGKEMYALPGGKQQEGETLERCAQRELSEETRIKLRKSRPVSIHVMRYPGSPQVYSIGVLAEEFDGSPQTIEHGQHEKWDWFDLEQLPAPLFGPTRIAISQFLENKYPILQWTDVEAKIAGGEVTKQLSFLDRKNSE